MAVVDHSQPAAGVLPSSCVSASRPGLPDVARSTLVYASGKHSDLRNSSYISFTYLPKENIELISTTYFQPLLKKFRDFRILNQITLGVKATQHFSLEVKWNYLHDRFPGGDAPRTTYLFATGLKYEL